MEISEYYLGLGFKWVLIALVAAVAAGAGFLFSAFIEMMQLVTTRGLCETDDVLYLI